MDNNKRYNPMENVLNVINSKYISLPDSEKKRNNCILNQVKDTIVNNMKSKCLLFSGMFERTFYGGSFYDGLKVTKPNEFDLDLVLNIPLVVEPELSCTDQPGFVKVKINSFTKMLTRHEKDKFLKLVTLLDDANYLSVNKFLMWMEKVISLAIKEFPKDETDPEKRSYHDVIINTEETLRIYIKMKKGFPAFTLNLMEKDTSVDSSLDVDLVPCFQFVDSQWPESSSGYRQNPVAKFNKFLIVPKKPKSEELKNSATLERYWRLSFQEQERELITGNNLKSLKPALRLLKKLRDRLDHAVIASYYIKTLFLWTVAEEKNSFWSQSQSYVFMTMLKRYEKHISDQEIPYFWNSQYNMVGHLKNKSPAILSNIGQRLKKVIDDIEKNLDESNVDPFIVGKYLLSPEAVDKLRAEVSVSKKLERLRSVNSNNNLSTSITTETPNGDTVDSLTSISSSNNVPPLLKLGFSLEDVNQIKNYINYVQEEQTKKMEQMFTSHSVKINQIDESNAQKVLMNCLTKIDAKIDKLTEKVDTFETNNKLQLSLMTQFDKRIANLEDKVNTLQLENKILKGNTFSTQVDQLPFFRQGDGWPDNLGKPH